MSAVFYVYVIFRPNGVPCYIGKGTGGRWKQHVRRSHNRRLARIYSKAGGDLPIVKVRENLTDAEAFATEIALIAAIGRRAHGGPLVNLTDGGEGMAGRVLSKHTRALISASRLGVPMPEEQKHRISAALLGKKKHPDHGARVSAGLKGHGVSEETRKKISDAKRGKPLAPRAPLSDEHRERLRLVNLGKKASEETRAKMSAQRVGRKHPPRSLETRAKISATRSGKPLSAAHRSAISDGLRARGSRRSRAA